MYFSEEFWKNNRLDKSFKGTSPWHYAGQKKKKNKKNQVAIGWKAAKTLSSIESSQVNILWVGS